MKKIKIVIAFALLVVILVLVLTFSYEKVIYYDLANGDQVTTITIWNVFMIYEKNDSTSLSEYLIKHKMTQEKSILLSKGMEYYSILKKESGVGNGRILTDLILYLKFAETEHSIYPSERIYECINKIYEAPENFQHIVMVVNDFYEKTRE